MLGSEFRFGLTRPGIGVYGGAFASGVRNPMRTVVTAEARVAQVRHAKAGETVSYGATETLARDTIIAVAAVGYADGYHRAASGSGVRLREMQGPAGHGFVQGQRVPILGRVTMDLTMFDVTDLGEGMVNRGRHDRAVRPEHFRRRGGSGRRHDRLRAADRPRPALPSAVCRERQR